MPNEIPAKTLDRSIVFKELEYLNDCKVYRGDIFVAGHTHKVENKDTHSSNSYLYRCDPELNIVWSLKFDFTDVSELKTITVESDKIYALVVHGKLTGTTNQTFIKLYIISLDGEILETAIVSENRLWHPSNIVIHNNKLHFTYTHPDSETYFVQNKRMMFVEYDLKTKKVTSTVGSHAVFLGCKLVLRNSQLILAGTGYNEMRLLVKDLADPGAEIREIYFPGPGSFLDAYISDDDLFVITMLQHNCEDAERNIKISKVDLVHEFREDRIFYSKQNNWMGVAFGSSSDGNTTWVQIAFENLEMAYVQMGTEGPVAKIDIKGHHRMDKFFITDNIQIEFKQNKMYAATFGI